MLDVSALYVLLLDYILFMVVAVLCMWLSSVYFHLICMCGLSMWTCCTDCIDVLLRCRAAGNQYPEGPALTGHLGTGFSWFPCVYKQMLRWFSRFQVATTSFSCSSPEVNYYQYFKLYTCKLITATG
jgi:hypothetical protein